LLYDKDTNHEILIGVVTSGKSEKLMVNRSYIDWYRPAICRPNGFEDSHRSQCRL